MFYFKVCTKCNGDLSLEGDSYGSYLKCLQCGKLTEVDATNGQRSVLYGSPSNEVAVLAPTQGETQTVVAA